MEPEFVRVSRDEGVAVVTIDRPPVNALNFQAVSELSSVFDELACSSDVAVVILTGKGEKAFVAGADIKEFPGLTRQAGIEMAMRGHALMSKIATFGRPVIAAINGLCLGGGCELALACDLRVASEAARFGQPEVNLGLIPGYGGTQRLPRLVGPAVAKELLFTGSTIDAQEALRIGLVNRVVPHSELMNACFDLARTILSKAPVAVGLAKRAVDEGMQVQLEEGLELEARYFGDACATEDMREGVQAFLEKRKPQFTGT
ncbi:MAG: enoyl-CoA hydratase/isomerase family protein [Bacillota bacterium]